MWVRKLGWRMKWWERQRTDAKRMAGPDGCCSGGALGSGKSWVKGMERRGWLAKINQSREV